ncbi:MAG: hypothetical protein ACI83Y_000276, partial [Candidatus Azotimanducaceae bacterium]
MDIERFSEPLAADLEVELSGLLGESTEPFS